LTDAICPIIPSRDRLRAAILEAEASASLPRAERRAARWAPLLALLGAEDADLILPGCSLDRCPDEWARLRALDPAMARALGDAIAARQRAALVLAPPAELARCGPVLAHPDLSTPPGYVVDASGVWLEDDHLTHAPILVSGLLVEAEGEARAVEVAWTEGGEWRRRVVPREQVSDARSLLALSGLGAPVDSDCAGRVVRYLSAFQAHNYHSLPRRLVSRRLGWHGDGYLAGIGRWVGAGEPVVLVEGEAWASGWGPRGTLAGWLRAVGPVVEVHPSAAIAIYAALAAPILGRLDDVSNAIIDWSGETSHGKTTVLRLAASCWGSPDERHGVLQAWDATASGIERLAERLQHAPLILDDSKRARNPQQVRDLIYSVANGIGRTRATPDGLRPTARWRTILLSSGEQPATYHATDAGARARCLSLRGLPFAAGSRGLVERLVADLYEHHGHAGAAAVGVLAGWRDLAARYRAAEDAWAARLGDGGACSRQARTLALLSLGADLAAAIGLPGCDAWTDYAAAAASASARDADAPSEALRVVWDVACSRQIDWYGRHHTDRYDVPDVPAHGWLGVWPPDWTEIGWLPSRLHEALREAGYEPEAIIESWDHRGWIRREKGRNRTVRATMDREQTRVLAILRSAIEEQGLTGAPDSLPLPLARSIDGEPE